MIVGLGIGRSLIDLSVDTDRRFYEVFFKKSMRKGSTWFQFVANLGSTNAWAYADRLCLRLIGSHNGAALVLSTSSVETTE